jgi:hypothetical protein
MSKSGGIGIVKKRFTNGSMSKYFMPDDVVTYERVCEELMPDLWDIRITVTNLTRKGVKRVFYNDESFTERVFCLAVPPKEYFMEYEDTCLRSMGYRNG